MSPLVSTWPSPGWITVTDKLWIWIDTMLNNRYCVDSFLIISLFLFLMSWKNRKKNEVYVFLSLRKQFLKFSSFGHRSSSHRYSHWSKKIEIRYFTHILTRSWSQHRAHIEHQIKKKERNKQAQCRPIKRRTREGELEQVIRPNEEM